jgi:hypothetical protein
MSAEKKARAKATKDATLHENTWRYRGLLWFPDLDQDEDD